MLKKPVLHQEFEFVMIEELVPEKLRLPSVSGRTILRRYWEKLYCRR